MSILPATFYARSPNAVARELVGKKLTRRLGGETLSGVVVETEAYFGETDPASRARRGRGNQNAPMWRGPGTLFVYNVHKYWMLNVIAHVDGEAGGVLFRAIEPVNGIDAMLRNRQVGKLHELTSGPGKLSLALGIVPQMSGLPVTTVGGEVTISEGAPLPIHTSRRIGVTEDLPVNLRFYADGNPYVSRR